MALHKEIIERHQNSIIFKFTAMLLVFIVGSDFLNFIVLKMDVPIIIKYVLNMLMILMFFCGLKRLRIKYKYSLIQEELMIHKIIRDKESLLQIVNINDIVYVSKCNSIKDIAFSTLGKRYDFYRFSGHNYVCVYNDKGVIKKFYFNPSTHLIKMLEKYKVCK